jgi:thiol-disulfide isomerase/thioredoxin
LRIAGWGAVPARPKTKRSDMNRAERRRGGPPSRVELEAQIKRRRIILYGLLAVVIIGLFVAVGYANRSGEVKTASDAPALAKISIGDKAPQFSVSSTGGPFDLNAAAGKPTLLEVFATWCPHCQKEAPVLSRLNDKFKGQGNVIGVSGSPYSMDSTSPENQADVIAFTAKYGARYPVAFDPDLDVAKKYLQGGFPTIVLIGSDGKILAVGSGEVPEAGLQKALANAIAGKPVSSTFDVK